MSAMVLRTGSKTRKLTDRELIQLACWLRNQADVARYCVEGEIEAGNELSQPDTLEREAEMAEFLALPEHTKAVWITIAEANYLTVCMMLGDRGRVLPEMAEGGPTP